MLTISSILLITDTLTSEYAGAAEEYNTLTASTQAARDATNRMEQSQAALGEAMEPVSAAMTAAKTAFFDFASTLATAVTTSIEQVMVALTGLDAKERAVVNSALDAAESLRAMREASAESSDTINAQYDFVQTLADELFRLADANGFVEENERRRVDFILNELNNALGTEYTLIDNQIQKYGELKQSIEDVIATERAKLLLAEYEDDYVQAVKAAAEAENARTIQRDAMYQTMIEQDKAYSAWQEKQAEYNKAVAANASAQHQRLLGEQLLAAEKTYKNKGLLYERQREKLEELENAHKEATTNINTYEAAKTEILAGNTDKAIKILNGYDAALKGQTEATVVGYEKQIEAARKNVIDTGIALGLLEDEYKQNQKYLTEAQKKEMEARIEAAEQEAQDARREFKAIGGNMIEGLVEGAKDKNGESTWNLGGFLKQVVLDGIATAKEAAKIKSPSRLFRDEVGKMLVAGIAVGVEDWADKPVKAIAKIFDSMQKLLDAEHKDAVDTIKDYNTEIADLEKEKNKRLSELAEKFNEDKAKKGADIKALEKQNKKDIESINEQHAEKIKSIQENMKKTITDKMGEILSLEEKYKEDVKSVWDDLAKSIEDVQANYDDQLKSRTESIVSSLSLWNEATKNKTTGVELTKNLKSQVKMLDDFNSAIAKLEERNVNEAFLNTLKGMGVGATGEIQAIAKMTDKQLSAYVELWEKKNELARNAAVEELEPLKAETEAKIEELTNAALDKYAELRAKYTEQGFLLMAELKQAMIESGQGGYAEIIGQIDEYTSAGEDLMDGVIVGITDKSPEVAEAVKSAVRRAINAAKMEAGIASPSKVMKKEIGYNLADGVSVGWSDKVSDLKNQMAADMQGITERIKTAVMLENSRMSQGVGVRDTGFTEIAQAVGTQTAGINSLASEYRRGSSAQVTVPLVIDGREFGRAVVDLGNAETVRTGASLSFA